jgi:hypothetical protein
MFRRYTMCLPPVSMVWPRPDSRRYPGIWILVLSTIMTSLAIGAGNDTTPDASTPITRVHAKNQPSSPNMLHAWCLKATQVEDLSRLHNGYSVSSDETYFCVIVKRLLSGDLESTTRYNAMRILEVQLLLLSLSACAWSYCEICFINLIHKRLQAFPSTSFPIPGKS